VKLFVSISTLQTLLINVQQPTADQKHAQHSLGLVICLVIPHLYAARDEYTVLVMPQRRVNVLRSLVLKSLNHEPPYIDMQGMVLLSVLSCFVQNFVATTYRTKILTS